MLFYRKQHENAVYFTARNFHKITCNIYKTTCNNGYIRNFNVLSFTVLTSLAIAGQLSKSTVHKMLKLLGFALS